MKLMTRNMLIMMTKRDWSLVQCEQDFNIEDEVTEDSDGPIDVKQFPHVINVNIIFFISEILFHSRMPTYYFLIRSRLPGTTSCWWTSSRWQVLATNICMIQDLFPTLNPDLCSVPCLMDIVRALLAIKYRVRWEYSEYTRNKLEVSLGRICQVRKVK